jgi:hypothetical protein
MRRNWRSGSAIDFSDTTPYTSAEARSSTMAEHLEKLRGTAPSPASPCTITCLALKTLSAGWCEST